LRKVLSPEQAAEILGVTRQTVWALTRRGEIPYRRLGRKVLIEEEELEKWFSSLPGKSAGEVIQQSRTR
jgi:excisionase family DNA binding protein